MSPMGKILGKSVDMVMACWPSRKSHAMPTQSLPARATMEPPLIENGSDIITEGRWQRSGLMLEFQDARSAMEDRQMG